MRFTLFRSRILAFLIDYFLIILYGIFIVGSISILFKSFMMSLFSHSPAIAQLTGFCIITLPVSLYFIICESSTRQGTIGKRRMDIQVVDNGGKRINLSRSIIRTMIKFLPWEIAHFGVWQMTLPSSLSESTIIVILVCVNITIVVYTITPLIHKENKNIYDLIAGTNVVLR